MQRVYEEGGEDFPTILVNVVELARESVKVERNIATVFGRQTDLVAQLVETLAAGRTMCGQIMAV